ncbi:MAG: hypothetical protein DYH06_13960 [Acidobacteria bacterium ACB2]|nr:hypothetical protein [Acidobacteria bacterium ACB2]
MPPTIRSPPTPTVVPVLTRRPLATQAVPSWRSVWSAEPEGSEPPPEAAMVNVWPEGVIVTLEPGARVTAPVRVVAPVVSEVTAARGR